MAFPVVAGFLTAIGAFLSANATKILKWSLLAGVAAIAIGIIILFLTALISFIVLGYNHLSSLVSSFNDFANYDCVAIVLTDLGIMQFLNLNFPLFIAVIVAFLLLKLSRVLVFVYEKIISIISAI
ncbi:hypothetical protein FACS189487_00810 [Campylobacterota bacterium]|nr:hypothetical protein FACS189487_00810 [Campylobacterota bacterium]